MSSNKQFPPSCFICKYLNSILPLEDFITKLHFDEFQN